MSESVKLNHQKRKAPEESVLIEFEEEMLARSASKVFEEFDWSSSWYNT